MTTTKPTLPAHVRIAIKSAELAFWEVIAAGVPEATTGDLAPDADAAFTRACEDAARAWYAANVGDLEEREPALVDVTGETITDEQIRSFGNTQLTNDADRYYLTLMTNNNEAQMATITVGAGRPTTYDVRGGMDHDVTITIGATKIEGGITLAPSEYDGRMGAFGDLDHWCSDRLVKWIQTLARQARRDVLTSLAAGAGTEEVEIEFEARS